MTSIENIPGITRTEIKAFHSQNIQNMTDLWIHIGQDFDCGIDELADDTHIEKSRLIELLKVQALNDAQSKGSWVERHWLELAIVGLLLLIRALFFIQMTGVLDWIVLQ